MAKQPEAQEAEFRPNYTIKCDVCGQTPTVDIFVSGKLESHMEMCGCCTWGEAACIDPSNW
jgi:hypothetical protein